MHRLITPLNVTSRLAVVILLAYLFFLTGSTASADPYDYDYTYSFTNIYWDDEIDYDFTNLSATSTYTWTVQALSSDGSVRRTIKVDTAVEVVTAHFVIGGVTVGPIRVIDNFGKILGYHYIVPGPLNSDFYDDCLDRDFGDRIVAVIYLHQFTDVACSESTQYHQQSIADTSVTYGGYLLLHYAMDTLAEEDTVIVIHDLGATTDTPIATISLYDAECYLDDIGSNYFPLATAGSLPFVDHDAFDSCWVNGDNPTTLVLPVGAYEYAKIYDNDTTPDSYAGESTFIVTASPNTGAWGDTLSHSTSYLSLYSDVAENSQQLVDAFVYDSAVWAGYSNITVSDSDMGEDVETIDYSAAYVSPIRFTYTVTGTPGNQSTTTMSFLPSTTRYDRAPALYEYIIYGTYNIIASATRAETWRDMLERNGWTDPPQAVMLFFVLLVVTAGGFAVLAPGSGLLVGAAAYLILGVAFTYLGLFGILLTTIWVLGIIPAILLSWSGGSNAATE